MDGWMVRDGILSIFYRKRPTEPDCCCLITAISRLLMTVITAISIVC